MTLDIFYTHKVGVFMKKKFFTIFLIMAAFFCFNPLGALAVVRDLRKNYKGIQYSKNPDDGYIVWRDNAKGTSSDFGYYDKNFNEIYPTQLDCITFLDDTKHFHRYLLLENKEKYGLYDIKKKIATEIIYDKIDVTYGYTPILIKDNQKQYVQPIKRIGTSTVHVAKDFVVATMFVPLSTLVGVLFPYFLIYADH